MATLTTNLGLTKPSTTDFYDIGVQNNNLDLLDTAIAGKANTVHIHPIFATCATAAATKAKTITLTNFALESGAMVVVTFTNGNTNAAMTLNVNSTGAKSVVWQGSTSLGFTILTGKTATLVYNGTYWVMLSCDDFMYPTMKMEAITYTGTGSTSKSLTFSITPTVLTVASESYYGGTVYPVFLQEGTAVGCFTYMMDDENWIAYFTRSGKTVSWTCSTGWDNSYDIRGAMNVDGNKYIAIAWGY
ncbi:hypothetical protein RFF05_01850 [Bengtsoniella intestinalis]|uniref:hypothetical protein n=1 Tax=Bengtsoniella intestinalis TaxID=3073143 RepID=UPI00391F0DAC